MCASFLTCAIQNCRVFRRGAASWHVAHVTPHSLFSAPPTSLARCAHCKVDGRTAALVKRDQLLRESLTDASTGAASRIETGVARYLGRGAGRRELNAMARHRALEDWCGRHSLWSACVFARGGTEVHILLVGASTFD